MKSIAKKVLAVLVFAITTAVSVFGQNGFSYQAVIRNDKGELVVDKQVVVKFTLLHEGKSYYAETQKISTNQYGNIQAVVGNGEKVNGAFDSIPWSTLNIDMKVEVAIDGPNFIEVGTSKIQTAPYAIHAQKAGGVANQNANTKDGEALFAVNDASGNPVFAVFAEGIVVYVDDAADKAARRSGFVVTGRSATKDQAAAEYFAVTTEGTHIYVDDADDKAARRSGFVVTGRSATKDGEQADYLTVGGEGTTVYVDGADDKAARRSGFVVNGRSATKDSAEQQYFAATADGTTVYVDDAADKAARRSGFVVTGRSATKDGEQADYLAVGGEGTQVFIDGADEENDKAARRSGFVVTGRSATKADETMFAIEGGYTRVYVDDNEDDKAVRRSGFVVTGRSATKNNNSIDYMSVNGKSVDMVTSEMTVIQTPGPDDIAVVPGGQSQIEYPRMSAFSIRGGNVHVGGDVSLTGDVTQKVDADTIAIDTTEVEFPQIAKIVNRADTIDCSIYKPFIYGDESDEDGYAMLGIYSKGSYAVVDNTDALNNHVLLLDASGFVTKKAKNATVTVLMPEGDNQLYIRPLKATSQTINFGLMKKNATEPYKYVNVSAEIEASAGVPYRVTATHNNGGTVEIDGTMAYGDKPTFTAIPDNGFMFVRWTDGSTRPRHSVTIYDDFEIEAEFDTLRYILNAKPNRSAYGTVEGGGGYFYGEKAFLEAIASPGYYFNNWSGVELDSAQQDNPSIVLIVTENLKLIANFGKIDYAETKSIVKMGYNAENEWYVDGHVKEMCDLDIDESGTVNITIPQMDGMFDTLAVQFCNVLTGFDGQLENAEFKLTFDAMWTGLNDMATEAAITIWTGKRGAYWTSYDQFNDHNELNFENNESFLNDENESRKIKAGEWTTITWGGTISKLGADTLGIQINLVDSENNNSSGTFSFRNLTLTFGRNKAARYFFEPEAELCKITVPEDFEYKSLVSGANYYMKGDEVTLEFDADDNLKTKFQGWTENGEDIIDGATDLTYTFIADSNRQIWPLCLIENTNPFNGKAITLPGVIEAEDFDYGDGAFKDNNNGTSWNVSPEDQPYTYYIPYREETNVGIDSIFSGEYALSFTAPIDQEKEWYKYTMNVEREQRMRWAVRYANLDNGNAEFSITRGSGIPVTGEVNTPTTPGWWVYNMVFGNTDEALPTGTYSLRLNFTNQACNVDKIMFGQIHDALVSIDIQPVNDDDVHGWMPMGTVTGYGFYEKGSTATLRAKADSGYSFVGWKHVGEDDIFSADTVLNVMIEAAGEDGDIHYIAMFTKDSESPIDEKATITVEVQGSGQVIFKVNNVELTEDDYTFSQQEGGNPTYTFDCAMNDGVWLEAVKGKFFGWYENGVLKSAINNDNGLYYFPDYSFGVEDDHHFVAIFEELPTSDFTYEIDYNNSTATITGYEGEESEIVIPAAIGDYTVASIAEGAFQNKSDIESVIFADESQVASIGQNAFNGCQSLQRLSIPSSVTKIGADAFKNCNNLESVTFSSIAGMCQTEFVNQYSNPMANPGIGDDGVTLYLNGKAQQSISIPTDVDSVGQYAFFNSRQLTSVEIPSNVGIISRNAFDNCTNLSNVTIAEGVEVIGDNAFNSCGFAAIKLPNSLTTIGSNAFASCENLVSVVIPESVTSMGEKVFLNNNDYLAIFCLESGDNDEDRFGVWNSDWSAKDDDNAYEEEKNIIYEHRNDDNPNIERDEDILYLIYKYDEFEEISNISEDVLRHLTSEDAEFEDNDAIVIGYRGNRAVNAEDYPQIVIPYMIVESNVVAIARYAFLNENINELSIGTEGDSYLRLIGQGAFCGVWLGGLEIEGDGRWCMVGEDGKEVDVDEMNAGTLTAGSCANEFRKIADDGGDLGFTYTVDESNQTATITGYNGDDIATLIIPATVGDDDEYTVTAIGDEAFLYNAEIETLKFAENSSVASIGISAFGGCQNLTSILLPQTITTIGARAFDGCTGLTTIGMSKNISVIGEYAFSGTDLQEVNYRGSDVDWDNINIGDYNNELISVKPQTGSEYEYTINDDQETVTITSFNNPGVGNDVTVPSYIVKYGQKLTVTAIGDYAFSEKDLTGVSLPSTITIIGVSAFANNYWLRDVNIPEGVTSIGSGAFQSTRLQAVFIPSSVTEIDAQAFQYTTLFCEVAEEEKPDGWAEDWAYECNVTWSVSEKPEYGYRITDNENHEVEFGPYYGTASEYTIPSTIAINGVDYQVTSLSFNAFSEVPTLRKVTIPEGVTAITSEAFWMCENLEEIHIPSTVEEIEGSAFYLCKSLQNATIADGNEHFTMSDNSILYSADGTKLVMCFNKQTELDYTLPSNVTEIGDYAFESSNLASIDMSDATGLVQIGKSAFSRCSNNKFKSVEIPSTVTNIGMGAFDGCSSIESINIPEGVTQLNGNTFISCKFTSIEIPASVKVIGLSEFWDCTNLTTITLHDGLEEIGKDAFCRTKLTSLDIPESVYHIDQSILNGCSEETLSTMNLTFDTESTWYYDEDCTDPIDPEEYMIEDVVDATKFAQFNSGNEMWKSHDNGGTDPSSSNFLFDFDEDNFIATIIEYLGSDESSVEIPGTIENDGEMYTVTAIGDEAFKGNTSLETVTFADDSQVFSIGEEAFSGCTNLQSLELPLSVGYLGPNVCDRSNTNILDVIFTVAWYSDEDYSMSINPSDVYSGAYTEGMWRKNYDFEYDYDVDARTATITSCSGSAAKVIAIPEKVYYEEEQYTVTKIDCSAFNNCPNITKVSIPKTVTEIVSINDLSYLKNLQAINVNSENEKYRSDGGVLYGDDYGENAILCYPRAKSGTSFTIPDGITKIGYDAFARTGLEEITLSSSVTIVDSYAFDESNSLEAINVAAGSNHFSSENGILYSIDKKTLVRYPIAGSGGSFVVPQSVNSLYDGAFGGCLYLTSVTIPDGAQLGYHLFQSNTVIEEVNLPSTIETIPGSTFMECSSLTNITIPETVTKIEAQAFQGCGFTEIVIPSNVAEIESDVFYLCEDLTTISIPATLTTIADAFDDCSSLETVYFGGTELQRDALLEQLDEDDVLKSEKVTWVCGTYPAP